MYQTQATKNEMDVFETSDDPSMSSIINDPNSNFGLFGGSSTTLPWNTMNSGITNHPAALNGLDTSYLSNFDTAGSMVPPGAQLTQDPFSFDVFGSDNATGTPFLFGLNTARLVFVLCFVL